MIEFRTKRNSIFYCVLTFRRNFDLFSEGKLRLENSDVVRDKPLTESERIIYSDCKRSLHQHFFEEKMIQRDHWIFSAEKFNSGSNFKFFRSLVEKKQYIVFTIWKRNGVFSKLDPERSLFRNRAHEQVFARYFERLHSLRCLRLCTILKVEPERL